MNWAINVQVLVLILFATLLSYNFQRIVRHRSESNVQSNRHKWVFRQKKSLYALILFYFTACCILFFKLFNANDLLYFSPLIIIALFYAVKFPNSKKALRDISFIKIVLISASWAGVSVLIPAFLNEALYVQQVWLLFLLNFLYIFSLVIPFDIRDLPYDEEEKNTIPQLIGIRNSKLLANSILILCMSIAFVFNVGYISVIPVYIISMLAISQIKKNSKELYYSFVIDGLILLFPVITLIVKFAL